MTVVLTTKILVCSFALVCFFSPAASKICTAAQEWLAVAGWCRSGEQQRGDTHVRGQEQQLCWGSREDVPHVQGKRNPRKTVATERGHQRADRLKQQSQKTNQTDHMDHSLVYFNGTMRHAT